MALIEREALIEELKYYQKEAGWGCEWNRCIGSIIEVVEAAHPIDAAPVVHGQVLHNGNPICGPCSECGESVNRQWHLCPNA